MIYIKNGSEYLPIELYQNVEIVEEVGGNLTLSFTTFNHGNNPYHKITEETVITVGGYDFRVKQIKENGIAKSVAAVSTFFDLGGDFIEEIYAGTKTISDFARFMMRDSGWKYSLDIKDDKYIFIPNFGYANRIKMIQDFCQATGLEYQVFPNKLVKFAPKEGNDYGAQYRYGYNVKTIDRVVDTTNLKTRIRGFNEDGTYIEMLSDNHKQFGIIDADPIKDQKFESEAEFKEYLRSQLQDVPEIAITLDTIELTNKELGEHVWLIYEPLNLKMSSRILSKTTSIVKNKLVTTKVVIGNFKGADGSDLYAKQQVEIDKNKKQSISYFEQTNDKIRMAVEEWDGKLLANKAEWEMTATQIRSELWSVNEDLDGKITKANSRITQTAKEIRSEVSEVKLQGDKAIEENKSLISQTAREIRSEVSTVNKNAQDGILQANSKISQTATTIRSEISQVEKDLQKGITTTNSKIEQTSSSLTSTIESNYTNLNGKITATNSKIEQTASSLTSEISTVDRNAQKGITEAKSSISQTDRDIRAVVSTVEDVEGQLVYNTSQVNILRNEVSMKVSEGQVEALVSVGVKDGISNATIQADQINFRGSVFGHNATFAGDLSTPRVVGTSGSSYGDVLLLGYSGARINYQNGAVRLANDGNNYIRIGSSSVNFVAEGSEIGNFNRDGLYLKYDQTIVGHLTVKGTINGQKFTSKRELKKNIEPMKDNAIKKVMTTPIYKYNYIDDLDGELKYTGAIIDEAVSDIVNVDGETINIYSMTSVLWKAVQEQQQLISKQQEQINALQNNR